MSDRQRWRRSRGNPAGFRGLPGVGGFGALGVAPLRFWSVCVCGQLPAGYLSPRSSNKKSSAHCRCGTDSLYFACETFVSCSSPHRPRQTDPPRELPQKSSLTRGTLFIRHTKISFDVISHLVVFRWKQLGHDPLDCSQSPSWGEHSKACNRKERSRPF